MKIRITESQYRILVNKPRDVVFGNINEGGGRPPRETPEEIDTKIKEILNHVRNGGEFIRSRKDPYYRWLEDRKKSNKKIIEVLDEITEIQNKLEDEKIEEIKDYVRNGGEFIRNAKKNPYYRWLESKKIHNKKFQKVLDEITEIQNKLEDEKIEEIKDYVRNGGDFIRDPRKNPYYLWLVSRKRHNNKFQNALDQIYEIQAKLGIKREWWGERVIKDTLIGMGFEDIPRQGQHTYKDCKNSLTCKFYKFDIYLPYNENNYMVGKNEKFYIPETGIIFEYDGIQHFQSNEHFGGEEGFKQRIHSDKEKNSFCQNRKQNEKPNPIKLVRIPYTSNTESKIKNDIVSALKDPSTFILTGDYPQLGWNQK